jgi:signal transduction histidine kinase
MSSTAGPSITVCLELSRAIGRAQSLEDIYTAALDALGQGLGVSRSSILLFDAAGVMRFKAHRNLSERYRRAVEGHTPWTPESVNPQPIIVGDVVREDSLQPFLPAIAAEGIAAMGFIPLVSARRVIGKFMVYYDAPTVLEGDQLQLAEVVAAEVAFAIQRTRAEAAAEEANQLKDEFLATLSHELRTPLNAILGWTHVLETDSLPAERAKHARAIVSRNAKLQAQLIEDILDISRIIKGKLEIERRPMNVGVVLANVLDGMMPAAAAKHIQVVKSPAACRRLKATPGDCSRSLATSFRTRSSSRRTVEASPCSAPSVTIALSSTSKTRALASIRHCCRSSSIDFGRATADQPGSTAVSVWGWRPFPRLSSAPMRAPRTGIARSPRDSMAIARSRSTGRSWRKLFAG